MPPVLSSRPISRPLSVSLRVAEPASVGNSRTSSTSVGAGRRTRAREFGVKEGGDCMAFLLCELQRVEGGTAQLEPDPHRGSLEAPEVAPRPDHFVDAARRQRRRPLECESLELMPGLVPELDPDLATLEVGSALVERIRKLGIE